MENLNFKKCKTSIKNEKGINYNRLASLIHLNDIKNVIKRIANHYDIMVSYIDPKYTSKQCIICGNIDKNNRLSQEIFKCTCCGHTTNADVHAACNIKNRLVLFGNKLNIKFDKDNKTVINLAAWGDVITNIEAKNGEDGGTITFTYWLGVHLKAKKDNRYVVNSPFVGIFDNNGNKDKIQFSRGDIITQEKYEKIDNAEEAKEYCDEMKWYSQDDDGNYKYYFKDFEADTTSPYGANHGVKYTETYIYYKGNPSYEVIKSFNNGEYYEEGDIIPYDKYKELSVDNKKKCKPVEETIWSLVDSEKFDRYVNGEFDREYKPDGMTEEDADAPYYYRLYDKMEFYTGDNIYSYNIRIGNRINKVPFLRTNFTTTVDIKHVDIEERPLIRYDYYNGVSFQPSVNEDVYVERGVTQAFEKHIKFSEIKTFEDLENYANGGFFVISKEDIDLG